MLLFALCFEPQLIANALSFGCHQDGNFLRENTALLSPPRTETPNGIPQNPLAGTSYGSSFGRDAQEQEWRKEKWLSGRRGILFCLLTVRDVSASDKWGVSK